MISAARHSVTKTSTLPRMPPPNPCIDSPFRGLESPSTRPPAPWRVTRPRKTRVGPAVPLHGGIGELVTDDRPVEFYERHPPGPHVTPGQRATLFATSEQKLSP